MFSSIRQSLFVAQVYTDKIKSKENAMTTVMIVLELPKGDFITPKWFQVLLCITNNPVNISHLFTHS